MIDLRRYATMDVNLLYSAVNSALRDHFSSLNELANYYEIDAAALETRLQQAGFCYLVDINEFRRQ